MSKSAFTRTQRPGVSSCRNPDILSFPSQQTPAVLELQTASQCYRGRVRSTFSHFLPAEAVPLYQIRNESIIMPACKGPQLSLGRRLGFDSCYMHARHHDFFIWSAKSLDSDAGLPEWPGCSESASSLLLPMFFCGHKLLFSLLAFHLKLASSRNHWFLLEKTREQHEFYSHH